MDVIWGSSDPALNKALGDWCSFQIFGEPGELQAPYTTMGVVDDRGLVAVIAFTGYQPDAGVIEVHGAATTPRWLTKQVLWEMFSFCFLKLSCQTVVMRCDPADRRLARILTSYGFSNIRLPRLRGREKDEILYILHDDVWENNGFHRENMLRKAG